MKSFLFKILLAAACIMLPIQPVLTTAVNASSVSAPTAQTVNDIKGNWAQAQIEKWLGLGFIKGYEDGTFKPGASVTRAEFVTMVNRVMGIKPPPNPSVGYKDVTRTDWFAGEIAATQAAGYMQGYQDGGFHPKAFISRNEAAAAVFRILKFQGETGQAGDIFTDDAALPTWAREAIYTLKSKGLLDGYQDGSFRGGNYISRGEVVVFLDRSLLGDQQTGGGVNPVDSGSNVGEVPITGNTVNNSTNNGTGDNGGIGAGNGSQPEDGIQLAPGVKPLSEEAAQQLAAVSNDGSGLTFNGANTEIANLQTGNIITLPPSVMFPTGAAKKVVAIQTIGNQTVVKTVTPELTEVVHQIELHNEVALKPDDIILAPGVTLETSSPQSSAKSQALVQRNVNARGIQTAVDPLAEYQIGDDLIFKFHKEWNAETKPNEDGISGSLEAAVDGKLKLSAPKITLNYDWDFPFKIASASLKLVGGQELSASIHGEAHITAEQRFELFKSQPMPIAETGAFVVITVAIIYSVDGQATFDVGFTTTATEYIGFDYDSEHGSTPVHDVDLDKDISMPKLQGKISQELSLSLEPELTLIGLNLTTLAIQAGLYSDVSGSISLESEGNSQLGFKPCYAYDNGWFIRVQLSLNEHFGVEPLVGNIHNPESFQAYNSCKDLRSIAAKKTVELIGADQSRQVEIVGVDTSGANVDATFSSEYVSSDPSLIRVDANGKITAAKDAKIGEQATITVTNGNLTTQVVVKVDIIDIDVSPTTMRIKPGASQALLVTALIRPDVSENVTDAPDITYISSSPDLINVDQRGLITAANSLKEADVTITVKYHDKTKTVTVAYRQDAEDIILRAEKAAKELFNLEAAKESPDRFDAIKPMLATYYTDKYINKMWKKVYNIDMKWFLEPNYLFPLTDGLRDTKTMSESGDKKTVTVYVPVVRFSNGQKVVSGQKILYKYQLVKLGDNWYIDDISSPVNNP